ncbi:hypothetical protein [Roseibium sp.]|uniref:hypothetical protein n=1 Tax=Roseibium sp. TaxID=1936156 RepID=UPI003B522A13
MSKDGDSDSDKDGLGGFGGIADTISDAFSGALGAVTDVAAETGRASREAAARSEAAASLTEAGFSNLSGTDTFSPSTGRSTGTTASAAATSTGTSERSSGLGVSSSGREASGPGGFSEGLGPDLTAALSSTALSTQGNLMQPYDPNVAATYPGALSPDRISTLTDTLTYTAPPAAREVEALNAYASPRGFGAQALERAGRFSKEALSPTDLTEYGAILGLVRAAEAHAIDPYNSLAPAQRGRKTPTHTDLTSMTVAEVMAFQKDMLKAGHETTVVGGYQVKADTLRETVDKLGIDPNTTVFDANTQDRIGAALADRRGFPDYKAGRISADQFADNLAKEWAGFAKANGKSHYEGVGSNKATVSRADVMAAVTAEPEFDLDVALAPAGVELDPIDMPGSAFASHNPSTPTGKERAAPDAQQVTTSTISVEPEQTTQTTAPTVNPHPEQTALGRLETTYLDPEVNTVETVTVTGTPNQPNQSAAAPSTTTTAQQTGQPEQATEETNQGLGPVGRGIVTTGVDAAVSMVPGVGIVNGVIAGVNALGEIVGFDTGIPSVGEFVADNIGNVSPGTDPAAPTETDPSEFVNETIEAPEAAAVAAVAASPSNTIQRLENTYMFPTPAERWGANARQYRGA